MNLAYLELKLCWQLHSRAPEALPLKEREHLRRAARRQEALESRILQSAEAMCTMVSPAELRQRLETLHGRYQDTREMQADLARLGMDAAAFEEAVRRDLIIENVLERISSTVPPVSETEAEIFYHLHPERFTRPETRELRHILITFKDDAERRAAEKTLSRLRATLHGTQAFAAAALRYSQCPTALDGGRLGRIRRGQLYPQVEEAAFSIAAGSLSSIVLSEMGLHLVRCESIEPECRLGFAEVKEKVVERLTAVRQEQAQRAWVAGLPGATRRT